MIYRRRRLRSTSVPSGFYRFEGSGDRMIFGAGDSDMIRLRDESGKEWRGSAECTGGSTIRYIFRDSNGNILSGISDGHGILLRDEHGNVWRGFID